jgi:hypothetical protein
LFGQEKNVPVFIKRQKTDWNTLVKNMEADGHLRFFYFTDSIPNVEIIVEEDSTSLDRILATVLSGYGIQISKDNQGNYFLFKGFSMKTNVEDILFLSGKTEDVTETDANTLKDTTNAPGNEFLKTYQELISENIVIGSNGKGNKNEKVTVSGIVTNSEDGGPIPQARLFIPEINKNFVTNSTGFYEMEIVPGNYTLVVNSLGMYEKKIKMTVLSKGKLNVPLEVKSFMLDETLVVADRDQNVTSTTMGFERITEKAIKELPVVLGEKDVVKIVLLMPGVQTVGEISSGFNVRGSPSDQNMFYINGLPVYNSSHLFGLFTTFNSDAIGEFKFYKNSIPVEYGGQLSSIFDIDVKKGNNKYFTTRGGIGPTSGRVLVEGPLKKDSSSFLVSVRSTYSDWLLNQVDNLDVKNSSASFQDALMDFSLQLDKTNNVDLFFYGSHDYADLAFGIQNEYSNLGAAVKWTHSFSKKLSSELNFSKSQYFYEEANYEIEYLGSKHSFDLNHNELKLNFSYITGMGHNFQWGLNSKFLKLNYGDFLPLDDRSTVKPVTFESEQALSNTLYIGDIWDISARLTLEGGIRTTLYSYLGPKTVYTYSENSPRQIENITDTTSYGNLDFINNYKNLDFRFSGKYELANDFSVKAGYNRLHQYIFMLSNTVTVSPISKWKLSDSHLKPMKGEQFSLGLYKNFWDNNIETSVEAYYKDVENLVEYKDGAEFITNRIPETNIIQGDLKSYGIEFMVKKKMDKLNGWINYTWSKAEVTALNKKTGEMNNQGLSYPANYDRPHAVNLH